MNKHVAVIYAPINTLSGYGSRARDFAKSLIQLKGEEWDIKIISCPWGNTPSGFIEANPEWGFLNKHIVSPQLNSQPEYFFWVTIPSEAQKVGKWNCLVTAGLEINIVPADWIEGVNKMDLVLVSSEHSKKAFLETKFQKVNDKTKQVEGTVEVKVPIEVMFEGVDINVYQPIEWID